MSLLLLFRSAEAGITGAASMALGQLTQTATASLAIKATSEQTLGGMVMAAAATLPASGTASMALGQLTQSATATLAVKGTAAVTLGALVQTATASLPITGTSAQTLGGVVMSGQGALPLAAASNMALGQLTQTATASLAIKATATQTLGGMVMSGTGTVAAAGIVGTSSMALGQLTQSAMATLSNTGIGAVALSPMVTSGHGEFSVSITQTRVNLIYQLALLHGLDVNYPLSVSGTARSAGALVQGVSGTDTVTITTATMQDFAGDVNAWIDALAAVHGLTVPLVVTASTRMAGSISQTINTSSGITTVVRQ